MDNDVVERASYLFAKKENDPILDYIKERLDQRINQWTRVTAVPQIHTQQGKVQELKDLINFIETTRKDNG